MIFNWEYTAYSVVGDTMTVRYLSRTALCTIPERLDELSSRLRAPGCKDRWPVPGNTP